MIPDDECPYDLEPECTCRRIDVDRMDCTDCDWHNEHSEFNRKCRQWDSEQEMKRERAVVKERIVLEAIRTEPDYGVAVDRLRSQKMARLLHAAMGMCTESAEFLDMLKKHIYYGKPLDTVNAIEEIGDTTWYQRIGCDELDIKFSEMIQRNVDKLRARFPDTFTEEKAVNRDLDGERKILEGIPAAELHHCPACMGVGRFRTPYTSEFVACSSCDGSGNPK